ncbi:MAG: bifunctional GNAT family N-acetyltransferase/thioesterase [Pseudomonadota bacterium]
MLVVHRPVSDKDLEEYFGFRWLQLRKPWGYPAGSEKDEYETVSEHRVIKNHKGDVVGCGRVHLNTSEEAQIRHIAVREDYRRKGVGQMVLNTLEVVAKDMGAERAVSNSRETSIPFFESAGFKVIDDSPVELGSVYSKQMCKHLVCHDALVLHPRWCRELQETWQEGIPISEQMGIKLYKYTERTFETRASLNKNINHHGTMFAGSIYSLATLTGWGMIFLQLKQKQLSGEIVLGDASIHYHKPITMKPRAVCNVESINTNFDLIESRKKCPVSLNVEILDGERSVADFYGKYWVLPKTKKAAD